MSLFKENQILPIGFDTAIYLINKIPQNILLHLSSQAIQAIQYKSTIPKCNEIQEELNKNNVSLEENEVKTLIHAILMIFREAALKEDLTEQEFYQFLSKNTFIKSETNTILATFWKEKRLSIEKSRIPIVGKIVDFQWKLGVSFESSHCVDLSQAFVSILMKVANQDNVVSVYSFEMTISEFENMFKSFEQMLEMLDLL
ncbi:comm domain-containing protein [Anaeramoeba ignava]|uniref:COMM domain-containing protein 6 n=1 Tax=Anaeramoeba ignava TaxID=1746090 RepID=A0A9Q0LZ07_ANAIG|nr:comm domain-containing protein [Anaeramoeba ignava]|eukprot:Anaeramoba_ignava/a484464_6.p1 GENE.a484464_6~~a484464_6.p1  ORF type:complete len:200 (-),score=81.68 a484464_6:51-650(-)